MGMSLFVQRQHFQSLLSLPNKLFFIFVLLLGSRFASAQVLGSLPVIEKSKLRFSFNGRSDLWTSPYQNKEAPVRIFAGSFKAPLFKTDNWQVSTTLQTESVSLGRSDIVIGRRERLLGIDLRHENIGLGVQRDYDDGRVISFYTAFVSASDHPFEAGRDQWFDFSTLYRSAIFYDDYRWIAYVTYSKNRGFYNSQVFPFIGISYSADKDYEFSVGFPFLIWRWHPQEAHWQFLARATILGVNLDYSYENTDTSEFYAAGAIETRSYLYSSRVEETNRLFFEETKVEVGFRKQVTDQTKFGFSLGRSLDRSLYESTTIYQHSGPRVTLKTDTYLGFMMEFQI